MVSLVNCSAPVSAALPSRAMADAPAITSRKYSINGHLKLLRIYTMPLKKLFQYPTAANRQSVAIIGFDSGTTMRNKM
ncbi:hypothetical protein D3C76_1738980 [compost metagenome]